MNWKPVHPGTGKYTKTDPKSIIVLGECQPRVGGIDEQLVEEYASDLRGYDEHSPGKGWQKFPHIECIDDNGDFILYSGNHRLKAMLDVGYSEVEIYLVKGTRQDAIVLSKGENALNGKRRSNADKAHVVRSCLLDDELKLWSNRQIAEWCGVAHPTVASQEKSLENFTSENGETYQRPTRRKRLDRYGEIEWIETNKIGNGSETSPQSELPGVPTKIEEKSKALRDEFFNLELKCKVRITSLDLKHFEISYLYRRMSKPATGLSWQDADFKRGIKDAMAWLTEFENPDPTGEMALMLEEIGLINEVFEIYKPLLGNQLHIDMLSTEGIDAKAAVLSLRTADWEAQDRSVRIEHLHDLKDVFAHVSEFEEKARDAREEQVEIEKAEEELHQARCDAEDAKCDLFETFKGSGLSKHINLEGFTAAAAKAFNCYKPNDEKSGEYYIVGEHVTGNLTLKEAQQWKARFEAMTVAVKQKAEWVKALFPQPQLDELKTELKQNHWDHAHHFDNLTPGHMNILAEMCHATLEDVRTQMDIIESEGTQQIKVDHSNARRGVQSAFFDTNMHHLMTDIEKTETGKKLQKFSDLVVDEKGLRLNIFSHDHFYLDESGVYKDRNMTYLEIESEIEVFDQIAKDVRFYMQGDENHLGWVDAVVEKLKPDTTVEPDPEQAQSEHVEQLKSLPAEIREYIPKWIRANPIRQAYFEKYEDQITLKLLLDARCQIEHGRERGADPFFKEEMEDLLNRMKTSDEALIAKVYELVAGEQDPSSDEWEEKWLPLLVDVFEGHAVKYVAVSIDQAVIQDYGSPPWQLSVEDLKRLISDAKTVIEHAKTPQVAWKRNRGTEDIVWALKVLGLDQKENSEINSEDVDTSNALAVVEFKVTAHGKATVIPGVSITDGTITNDEFDEILYSLEEDLKRHLAVNGIVVRG